jgi:UDP-N-acetylmuramyl pentapeptide synthase
MNLFSKIKFILKKPKIVIVTGHGQKVAREAISQIFGAYFTAGKNIFIFESDLKNEKEIEEFKFLINKSSLPVLIVGRQGDVSFDSEELQKLGKLMPDLGYLVLNFDDEIIRKIAEKTSSKTLTYGFKEGSDFQITDIKLNGGTNFKINYKGNIVPVWLERVFDESEIYPVLAVACAGVILGLNLIEISQALKNYRPKPAQKRESLP